MAIKPVTTTVTTLAEATKAATDKGVTIPDILLHEYILAERAVQRAEATKARLAKAIKQYMQGEGVTEIESAEARAVTFPVKNQATFDREGLERDHPAIYGQYYHPGVGTHPAFRVTPRA